MLDAVAGDVAHGQRVQFIADSQREEYDVAELARRYGISRKTAYKWMARYESDGALGGHANPAINRHLKPRN